ncbi:ribose-phosphate pyrophosphokinase [Candidatus Woesearchaeota archaeon]|nr:ribose-phosphate pyrophosphokinase [Candidatus Woesearchaeota archaeon]MBT5739879.1 ribose-phosphate pyrophosphokinase [Candidatus Woesearchaeota archaeon]
MKCSSLEKLQRRERLARLSNVVLVDGRSAEHARNHLEMKIAARMDKEFLDPSDEEKEIISELKEDKLKFAERTIKQQRDGEYFTKVGVNVRERDVHLFYQFEDRNLDMMELLVMGDTLKRSGVKSTTLYLPYIPYQRQDKKDDGRVPISAKLVFDLINASLGSSLKRIVTFDLHAKQAQGFPNIPVDELSAVPEFAAFYRDELKLSNGDNGAQVYVFSPDAGGAKRARYLAKLLDAPQETFDKRRIGHGEARTKFQPLDVEGKKVILIDDMIDSGGSLVGQYEKNIIGPVQYLQSLGADVYICASHRIFSEKNGITAEERFKEAGVQVLLTDSLPPPKESYYSEHSPWMNVISLNHAIAKAFYCNQAGTSISDFIQSREERIKAHSLDFLVERQSSGVHDMNL